MFNNIFLFELFFNSQHRHRLRLYRHRFRDWRCSKMDLVNCQHESWSKPNWIDCAWMKQVIAVSVWFTICLWTKISKIYEYLQYSVPFPFKIFIFLFQMYDTLGSVGDATIVMITLVVIVNRKTWFRFRWIRTVTARFAPIDDSRRNYSLLNTFRAETFSAYIFYKNIYCDVLR